ncbi:hypothetical protein CYMTET_24078 [Cymbomonas tetramitiformis]|uniref:Sialidase domain-containing protein n=1 Tax=Cymbomonas tetramitiformis TaxID=36881 RepID=A0AAE0L0B0_9CHLO|nr:hypothetical protein CYMTET_24078 [Cymbomonas tetramitiformis]
MQQMELHGSRLLAVVLIGLVLALAMFLVDLTQASPPETQNSNDLTFRSSQTETSADGIEVERQPSQPFLTALAQSTEPPTANPPVDNEVERQRSQPFLTALAQSTEPPTANPPVDNEVERQRSQPFLTTLAQSTEPLTANPPVDHTQSVDGCGNPLQPWPVNCGQWTDGKVYARGDHGPFIALANTSSAAHAATLIQVKEDESLLLAWFSGNEGMSGVVIVVSRLPAGAQQWTTPQTVSSIPGRSNQNPLLFQHPQGGHIFLLHTTQGGGTGQGTSYVVMLHSDDGGQTWSNGIKVKELSQKNMGPFIKGRILLSAASNATHHEWLLPMYYTPGGPATHYCTMRRSVDHGKHWTEDAAMSAPGQFLAQQSVVRLQNGTLRAFFRDRRARRIHVSDSIDDGLTWPKHPHSTALPSNDAGIQVMKLHNGHLVLAFNNRGGRVRKPLSLALSEDDGETWPWVRDLEVDAAHERVPPSTGRLPYSYPTLMQSKDGRIHVAYTYRRITIKYVCVDEMWIQQPPSGVNTTGPFKGGSIAIGVPRVVAPQQAAAKKKQARRKRTRKMPKP